MKRHVARDAKWLLAAPLVPAILFGSFLVFMALDHNPQGEFFEGGRFYFGAVFSIFYSGFAPAYLLFLGVGLVTYPLYRFGRTHGVVEDDPYPADEAASRVDRRLVTALSIGAALVVISYATLWISAS